MSLRLQQLTEIDRNRLQSMGAGEKIKKEDFVGKKRKRGKEERIKVHQKWDIRP